MAAKKKSPEEKRLAEIEAALIEVAQQGSTMASAPPGTAIAKVWARVEAAQEG